MSKKISIIVSVYNEEEVLFEFYRETIKVLLLIENPYEIIFVNDGSVDGSRGILFKIAKDDENVRVVHFSRNFGHEAAMIAGIDNASGDYLICMDADLQHPPTLLPEMVRKFESGYDIINMVRTVNKSAGIIKNITSSMFYKVINRLSDIHLVINASDFFGISKRVADVLRSNYREKTRFLRGYVQNVGFNTTNIEYEAGKRFAGKSKYSIKKLFRFSMNTIMTFSNLPLKLGIYAGGMAAFLAIIMMIYTIVSFIRVGTPSGYATTICLICFMFSVLFFIVGIIGEYLGIILSEIKDRPIYIVEEKLNFNKKEL
ncbi:glycosyltransferase family 2 protein [Lachnoanaerobaculum saburreum]|jgi:glycosyltransferase, group 2 family|uniref:Glycosyltransferase, group 2 family protein n=1 Tax=Lachnoanaerobaculum saburreum DSM 3986 TaxID=887325 RepID=E6LMU3_9FIRM|nr:glycosyltransferase family 2 protein [Lachnoanaerobaculum saburreum]EFU76902.1 glycosyltransferase, group 2 family protein [Lachnoanaerobaculum saburreum DSM 3986]